MKDIWYISSFEAAIVSLFWNLPWTKITLRYNTNKCKLYINAVKMTQLGFYRIMINFKIKKYHLYFIILDTCCVKKWQLRWGHFWRRWNLGMSPTSSLMSLFYMFYSKRFFTRGTLTSIRIPRLANILTLFHDWLRALK